MYLTGIINIAIAIWSVVCIQEDHATIDHSASKDISILLYRHESETLNNNVTWSM